MINTCNTCVHAVMDDWWGVYKCSIKQHVIFAGEGKDFPCSKYKNGIPKEAFNNKDYPNTEEKD